VITLSANPNDTMSVLEKVRNMLVKRYCLPENITEVSASPCSSASGDPASSGNSVARISRRRAKAARSVVEGAVRVRAAMRKPRRSADTNELRFSLGLAPFSYWM
jgi:hypothetical protein